MGGLRGCGGSRALERNWGQRKEMKRNWPTGPMPTGAKRMRKGISLDRTMDVMEA